MKTKLTYEEKKGQELFVSLLGALFGCAVALVLLITLSGCAGVGISHKLEAYRIDDRQTTERVTSKGWRPLKCWFVNSPECSEWDRQEVQGS